MVRAPLEKIREAGAPAKPQPAAFQALRVCLLIDTATYRHRQRTKILNAPTIEEERGRRAFNLLRH